MSTPDVSASRFCRIPLPGADVATRAFDLATQTSIPISDITPEYLFLCLPTLDCTAIIHQHGTVLAVAQCPLHANATLHTPPHIPAHLPSTVFAWSFPTPSHPHTLTSTQGSLARPTLHRQPVAYLPCLHSIVLRACHMLDASYSSLACLPARSLAFQCLALSLHDHCHTDTPPTATAVVRCIYDVARAWSAIAALLPESISASATILFAMPAVLEHSPRLGLVEMAACGDLRHVVVLRTRKVLEIVDVERKCLIVPSASAAEVVKWLCSPRTDLQVLSFADARAQYAKVWWYGSRACVQRTSSGGFVHGLPVYTALPHSPAMVKSTASLLARKSGTPLLLDEALFLSEYAVLTGGCVQNFDAKRWAWDEETVRKRAACLDLHGLDQPVIEACRGEATGVAPRRVLWSLCMTRGLRASPAVVVPNRLVANVHTSIAHKLVELTRQLGQEEVEGVREGCAVLVEMVQLSTGGEVRKVLEMGLGKVGQALAREEKPAVGLVHEELVHLVLFMFRYW